MTSQAHPPSDDFSDWIAVTARLPEPGKWVLVWTGTYHWIAMISDTFKMWVGTYENEYWSEPTHWMPLPAKPSQIEGVFRG